MQTIINSGELIQALNASIPDGQEVNSVHDYLERSVGDVISKTITINANDTSASVNVFQVTGSIEIIRLYGVITTATTLTNCTGAYFNLYDGTASVALTKNDGVLSGMAVGTAFIKNATATTTMAVADNAVGAVTEASSAKFFYPAIVTQKTGANTYIRFTYTTTDAPADATFTIFAEYRLPPAGFTGGLVAV
jgi:hypothetical protein